MLLGVENYTFIVKSTYNIDNKPKGMFQSSKVFTNLKMGKLKEKAFKCQKFQLIKHLYWKLANHHTRWIQIYSTLPLRFPKQINKNFQLNLFAKLKIITVL